MILLLHFKIQEVSKCANKKKELQFWHLKKNPLKIKDDNDDDNMFSVQESAG